MFWTLLKESQVGVGWVGITEDNRVTENITQYSVEDELIQNYIGNYYCLFVLSVQLGTTTMITHINICYHLFKASNLISE